MNLTDPQRRALAVIARRGRGVAGTTTNASTGRVHGMAARALVFEDLIERDPTVDETLRAWRLTDAGRQLAAELGLELKAAG